MKMNKRWKTYILRYLKVVANLPYNSRVNETTERDKKEKISEFL